MKINSSALSFLLGTSALTSSALAFVHSPPPRATSATLPIPKSRHHNRQRQITYVSNATTRSTIPLSAHNSAGLITQLAFYPSDGEPLSERLKNVQSEWENVKKDGLGKFFADELEAAEKIIQGKAQDAEKGAGDVISRGESGNDDYLLREGFQAMAETGKRLANEIWEVKQEVDEVKAAKIVEEATEDIVRADVLVEKELEKVVENVVSSLQEAEEVVQAAIKAVTSKEGLTDAAKGDLTAKLEAKAKNIEESIKEAESVTKTAKQVAIEDEKIMDELEKTGDRLSSAIKATESLTERLKGAEGGEALDAVSNTVNQAAEIVKDDLSAAESIADAVGQKLIIEADAVMSMNEKAADSVKSVRAAKTSIEESRGSEPEDMESLASALTKDAKDIELDMNTAKRLAEAIEEDADNDEEALGALERSSKEVKELIDAVDGAVDKAEDAVEGEISTSAVNKAVEKVEKEFKDAEASIDEAEEAAEKCEDCKVKDFQDEMKAASNKEQASSNPGSKEDIVAEYEEDLVVEKKEEAAAEKKEEVMTEKKEEVVAEKKEEVAAEKKEEVAAEKKEELVEEEKVENDKEKEVSSRPDPNKHEDADVKEKVPSENKSEITNKVEEGGNGEKSGLQEKENAEEQGSGIQSESKREIEPELESKGEEQPNEVSSVSDEKDKELLSQSQPNQIEKNTPERGTTTIETPETTTIASADHYSDSMGDAAAITANAAHTGEIKMASNSISSWGDFTDTMATAEPPEGLDKVLASAEGVTSQVSESILSSSDQVHDVAIKTMEALAETAAVISSLLL